MTGKSKTISAQENSKIREAIGVRETTDYLAKILSGEWLIHNPTRLDIPGFGRITATSTVLYHVQDGQMIPYFSWTDNIRRGEFLREGKEYFSEWSGR